MPTPGSLREPSPPKLVAMTLLAGGAPVGTHVPGRTRIVDACPPLGERAGMTFVARLAGKGNADLLAPFGQRRAQA